MAWKGRKFEFLRILVVGAFPEFHYSFFFLGVGVEIKVKGKKIDAIIMVLVAVDFLNCFILMPSKSHSMLMLMEDFNGKNVKRSMKSIKFYGKIGYFEDIWI